jgi:hypothetical protein
MNIKLCLIILLGLNASACLSEGSQQVFVLRSPAAVYPMPMPVHTAQQQANFQHALDMAVIQQEEYDLVEEDFRLQLLRK